MKMFPVLALAMAAALGGCASGQTGNSLDDSLEEMTRRLTLECYWQHEGIRLLYGGAAVHTACRRWADARVQVRMPESAVALRD